MAEIVNMPKMTDTMEEGVISSWLVKEGDTVSVGDTLAEVETDKATMELESFFDGTVLSIQVPAGEAAKVNQAVCVIGEKGEKFEVNDPAPAPEPLKDEKTQQASAPQVSVAEVNVADIPAKVVTMPLMSDTMTEGVIAGWLKNIGDQVNAGDIIAEVETDKATMELEAFDDGILLYQAVKAGEAVPVNEVVAVVGEKGTDYAPLLVQKPASEPEPDQNQAPIPEVSPEPVATSTPSTEATKEKSNGRVFATPLAKSLAKEKGIDIGLIPGSGPNGRVTKSDVESFKGTPASTPGTTISPSIVGQESFREEPVSQMRKTIARRLSESKFTAPHFYLTMAINMDKAMEARISINDTGEGKVSFNDLVIKATAMALRKHPNVNSSWLGDKIRYNDHIHIGVAVAVDEGLLVPVVRYADSKNLFSISAEVKDLAGKAKEKKLQPSDWEGNTFTISNLGMFGIDEFTAIINPPDACIMAVGGISETPKLVNGELVNTHVMKVTLSCDHRVVDGATGAAFLNTFKDYLENPVLMLA